MGIRLSVMTPANRFSREPAVQQSKCPMAPDCSLTLSAQTVARITPSVPLRTF